MEKSMDNLKYQDYQEHTLSFKSKLSLYSLSGTTEFPILNLYDKRQCILKMSNVYMSSLAVKVTSIFGGPNDSNNIERYSTVISLKAAEDFHFKPTEKIRVCICFKNNSVSHQCMFNLIQVSSKEFTDKQCLILPNQITSSQSITEIFLEINIKEYASPALIKDFTLLLNSEQYSDLTIDVRDKTFKVHKNIVFRRNGVLAKMIETDMVEKQSNKLILNDWQPEIVESFLRFVYTGTCEIANNYVELFQLAHFLQQSDLEKIVEKHMKHSITLDNFVVLFEIADLYSLKDLYNSVEQFFRANKDACVKNPKFEVYLRKSIKLSNIKFVLETAHAYNMNETLKDAMEFVKNNYTKIAEIPENRAYVQNEHNLLFKMFEHNVGYSPDKPK